MLKEAGLTMPKVGHTSVHVLAPVQQIVDVLHHMYVMRGSLLYPKVVC